MMAQPVLDADNFCLEGIVRNGDMVACGQTCAEPLTLSKRLVETCLNTQLDVQVFVGTLFSGTFDHAPRSMSFISYGAMGKAAALVERHTFDIVPERYSRLPALFSTAKLKPDVVLLQAAEREDGALSFGLACDYMLEAARNARIVIVELNPWVPWTFGTPWPQDLRIDMRVRAAAPPTHLSPSVLNETSSAIGRYVAEIIPDRATLQIGIGALPDATLEALRSHLHLGLHSGVIGDVAIQLIESGVLDNSCKRVDAGVSIANTVCAGRAGYDFVHLNPAVEVRHSDRVHRDSVLHTIPKFHAINSALEVDLSGQINCESVHGRLQGGIGGLLDFATAARRSPDGRSIIVLPSTAMGGKASRIVCTLNGPATIGRSEADIVVTEHGIADLRDISLSERARRLTAIAAPQFREDLTRDFQMRMRK